MPVKYRLKTYSEGGIYHIYNRGLDRIEVFKDESDYAFYLKLLGNYLSIGDKGEHTIYKERPYLKRHREEMNLRGAIKIMAYCLMPDHLHLLVKQDKQEAMTQLMRRVGTGYVMYFNKKYHRRGPLFEGVYKAVRVNTMAEAVYISRMIHLNPGNTVRRFGPVQTVSGPMPEQYMYSSLQGFLTLAPAGWLSTEDILKEFETIRIGRWSTYKEFVNDAKVSAQEGWQGGGLD